MVNSVIPDYTAPYEPLIWIYTSLVYRAERVKENWYSFSGGGRGWGHSIKTILLLL